MHQIFCNLFLTIAISGGGGVDLSVNIFPLHSAMPAQRIKQLEFDAKDLKEMQKEWERIWFVEPPSHLTPYPGPSHQIPQFIIRC